MTYDLYIKQRLPMCEIKLNHLVYKNPQLINYRNRFTIYPFFQEYAQIPIGESQDLT